MFAIYQMRKGRDRLGAQDINFGLIHPGSSCLTVMYVVVFFGLMRAPFLDQGPHVQR